MKKKIILALCALCLCGKTFAQLTTVDTTTPRTVYVTNSGYISIPGLLTNAAYTVTGTAVSKGDSLPVAFGKLGADVLYLQTNSSGGGSSGLTSVLGVLFYTNSITGTNTTFSGTNVWGEFTNSTAFITTGLLTNLMSFDDTNWLAYQATNIITSAIVTNTTINYIGTNSVTNSLYFTNYASAPVWLASSSLLATSTVTIYGVTLATPQIFSGGLTTNLQYVTGTLLSLTNHTATFTNGVLQVVTTP